MNIKKLITSILILSLIGVPVSATPDLQILSPQNTTYFNSKILINITSNETVDFSIQEIEREKIYLTFYKNNFSTGLYANTGSFNLTFYANNSNGTVDKSVIFTVEQPSNPINITTCGIITSPNTEYTLVNNISNSADRGFCVLIPYVRNVTLDLNNKGVTAQEIGIDARESPYLEIFDGDIYVNDQDYWAQVGPGIYTSVVPYGIKLSGRKYHLENLNIHGFIGMTTMVYSSVYENLNINASCGIVLDVIGDTTLKDSNINFSGVEASIDNVRNDLCNTSAFVDLTLSDIIIQNISIDNFSNEFTFKSYFSDYFLRNTNLNSTKIRFRGSWSEIRIYNQHLAIINVTDQDGIGVPAILNITDSGNISRVDELENKYIAISNPSSQMLVATDDSGIASIWLTERLNFYRVSSPVVEEEHIFSPYTLKAISRNASNVTEFNIETNSTFNLDIGLEFPDAEELPACTIQQMLDLNGDEMININDAIIVLRYITGLPVEVNTAKSCEGIDVNALL